MTTTKASRTPLSRWRLVALGAALTGVTGGAGVLAATAAPLSVSGSTFEIDADANLRVDDASRIDWLDGSVRRTGVIVKADDPSGSGDSSFATGTKEDSIVPTVESGGIPPNKSDLKQFGLYTERVGSSSYLTLFWTRVQDPSGTTNMDFEFNQSADVANNPTTAAQVVPVRTVGDLLLTYDLSRGGTVATISKRLWTGSVWGPAEALNGSASGTINTSSIPADQSGGLGALSPRTFGEASINLAAVLPAQGCTTFGSAYLKSRSSDSFTSALKDFVPPQSVNISNCGSVRVHKKDDAGAALGGAAFTLYRDLAPQGPTQQTAAGGEDKTTANVVGSCTTRTTATPTEPVGDCTIPNVPVGKYWLVETTVPANHAPVADQHVEITSGDQVREFTLVDQRLRGSILVSKVDATGAALAGAAFTVSGGDLPARGAAMASSSPGVFCLDNLLPGSYTVTETTVPNGYAGDGPKSFTVSGSSTCAARSSTPDLTFTNTPVPGTVVVDKQDDAGTALDGVGFTLYRDADGDGAYSAATDTTMAQAEKTTTNGTVSFTDVPLGEYCVVETTVPAGYVGAGPQCREVTLGSAPGQGHTITLTFSNVRTHRVITIVCHEGTDTLVGSGVTVDGVTKQSLAAAPAGTTAAELCGLGGASFGGRAHGGTTAAVAIPTHP